MTPPETGLLDKIDDPILAFVAFLFLVFLGWLDRRALTSGLKDSQNKMWERVGELSDSIKDMTVVLKGLSDYNEILVYQIIDIRKYPKKDLTNIPKAKKEPEDSKKRTEPL